MLRHEHYLSFLLFETEPTSASERIIREAIIVRHHHPHDNIHNELLYTVGAKIAKIKYSVKEKYSFRKHIARYRELRTRGNGKESNMSLLLASVTQDGKPRLCVLDDYGPTEPVHDNPGYALLGKDVITGDLLLRLLDYKPGSAWEWDLGLLSAFIIDMVSEVDPSVSPFLGESYLIRYDEDKKRVVIGSLTIDAYRRFKERVRKRRELFKMLWSILEDKGEDAVRKKLEELLEKHE